MTNKILAQAAGELIMEKPREADATLDRLRTLIATKYRGISWQGFMAALLEQIAQHKKISRLTVSSAAPMNESQKQALVNKFGSNNDYTWRVNERLLGGLVLSKKDKELDLSLAKKLQLLAKNLNANNTPS